MRPLVLVILDGWGYSPQKLGNAVLSAQTPTIDFIQSNYPVFLLQASSKSVGLSWAEPGNSEVGHLTIGAGRTIFQYAPRIDQAIESGSFFENQALLQAFSHVQTTGGKLHLVGLLGSGSVHSKFDHILGLLDVAKRQNVSRVYLHLFGDGKDSGLKEAPILVDKLQNALTSQGIGAIGTFIGRNFAMDRDNNWDRTAAAYNLWTAGTGKPATNLQMALNEEYQNGKDDTHLEALLINPDSIIQTNDSIIFFNFREDSMRQIARSFIDPQFNSFQRTVPENLFIACMTQYIEDPLIPLHIAFPPPHIENGLGETIGKQGIRQLHIAETEKYAHVTYFFNGLRNLPFDGEDDVLIDSDKDHVHNPQMRASEIADAFIKNLETGDYGFTVINFANADILSHTGNLEAATAGVGFIDSALNRVYQAILAKDGVLCITADHGNAESLVYRGGDAETKHNTNPVPFYIVAKEYQRQRSPAEVAESLHDSHGIISDVAPTILKLLGIEKPAEMTGDSLVGQIT